MEKYNNNKININNIKKSKNVIRSFKKKIQKKIINRKNNSKTNNKK